MSLKRRSRHLCLALVLAALPAGATPADPALDLAQSYAKQALALYHSPRAAAYLIRLQGMRDEVEDLNLLAQTYHDLLSRRSTDPLVRAVAREFYADVERARGRYLKSTEQLEPLGFIRDFLVLGSFDNEGKSGCGVDFGPEAKLDLKAAYPSKWRERTWRKVPQRAPDGYVDLSAMMRPNKEVVAYALTVLQSPRDTKTALSLGASGAFRLWVNGTLAASESRYNLPRPDQTRVAVRLRKGANRVLLKVCQNSGPFGFYLRQDKSEGAAGALATLPEPLPPLEKGPPVAPAPLPTLTSLLAAQVKAHPDDATLRGEYASVLGWFRAFDSREHTDIAEAERAADQAPKDVALQLLAAQLDDEDSNLRRRYLEAARAADPGSPLAALALAKHELARGHASRAVTLLEALTKASPGFARAGLALADATENLGDWPAAAQLYEKTFLDFQHLPVAAREAAQAARRLDRTQDAMARYRVALALRYDDGNARRSLESLLADVGRADDAAKELGVLLKQDPFDNTSRLHLAALEAANGHLDTARQLFAEAKDLSPTDPEVHEKEGHALLNAGLRDEALAAFGRSLALRPQNPALKDVLHSLQPGDATFLGGQYAVGYEPLLSQADRLGPEDAVVLIDNTYVRVQENGLSSRFHQLAAKAYNARGVNALRRFRIDYAPSRQEVRILKARVVKPDGAIIESYEDEDLSVNEPWTGMYYDTHARVLSFAAMGPGDVFEIQYRIEDSTQDNLLSDYWGDVTYVQGTAPKVLFQYVADMPDSRPLYRNQTQRPQGQVEAEQTKANGRTLYRFQAHRVPKVVPEPNMPGQAEVFSTLHVSTYKSWDLVGRYYWGLVQDQLTPNDEIKRTVDKALKGVNRRDELAVIRALYDFVVTNTRYVALEFGIHGYKPYRVDRVLARRFGDCKDKASLLEAMLKVAGIDSRLVLLRMRQLGTLGEEPASLAAFNHAILYVPKYQLYLDGTADFHGARELPGSDRLANALVVEPAGQSQFLTTPGASADDNVTQETLDVALKTDGSARLLGKSAVKGELASEYRRQFQAAEGRKVAFEQQWARIFPGLTAQKVEFADLTKLDQDVSFSFDLKVPRFAEALPNALRFFPLGSGQNYTQAYAPLVTRQYDVVLPSPGSTRSTYRFTLPAGYSPQDVPQDASETTPFGRYALTHKVDDGKLVFEAEVALTAPRVKVQDYPAFRAFLGRIDQAFSRKVVVSRTSGQTAAR